MQVKYTFQLITIAARTSHVAKHPSHLHDRATPVMFRAAQLDSNCKEHSSILHRNDRLGDFSSQWNILETSCTEKMSCHLSPISCHRSAYGDTLACASPSPPQQFMQTKALRHAPKPHRLDELCTSKCYRALELEPFAILYLPQHSSLTTFRVAAKALQERSVAVRPALPPTRLVLPCVWTHTTR